MEYTFVDFLNGPQNNLAEQQNVQVLYRNYINWLKSQKDAPKFTASELLFQIKIINDYLVDAAKVLALSPDQQTGKLGENAINEYLGWADSYVYKEVLNAAQPGLRWGWPVIAGTVVGLIVGLSFDSLVAGLLVGAFATAMVGAIFNPKSSRSSTPEPKEQIYTEISDTCSYVTADRNFDPEFNQLKRNAVVSAQESLVSGPIETTTDNIMRDISSSPAKGTDIAVKATLNCLIMSRYDRFYKTTPKGDIELENLRIRESNSNDDQTVDIKKLSV